MVEVGELQGVELHYLDALCADAVQVAVAQRAVVGAVAEGVEQGAHLYALACLLRQQAEQGTGDAVVAEVEVLQVYVVARPADGLEQVDELVVPAHQQLHLVVAGDGNALTGQVAAHQRIAYGLGKSTAGQGKPCQQKDR